MDLNKYIDYTEHRLRLFCDRFFEKDSSVAAAARYSLLDRGKRVRANLIYLTASLLGSDWKRYSPFACAVEMIHCYSLIHDDLPCMDDDDFRRGKPSCHVAHGEATALLAGDALLGMGLETIAYCDGFSAEEKLEAMKAVTMAMGPQGMIYGQELDLKYENSTIDIDTLKLIHRNKTGAMISLCGKLGSLGAVLSEEKRKALEIFFADVGLVFQIVDDILDVESTTEELGKPVGSDEENRKSTYVSIYGLGRSKEIARQLTDEAEKALTGAFGEGKCREMLEYTDYLLKRRK